MSEKTDATALKKIYERLRKEDKVKSQREFASIIKYNEFPVSKMLLGQKPIPYTLLVNLYNTFSVNVNFVISEGNGPMFLSETEKVTKRDIELANKMKEENEKIKVEIETLRRMITDKDKIIALLEKHKA